MKNLTKLSLEKVEILQKGAKDFYSEYFDNYGDKIVKLYKKFDEQEIVFE